MFGDHAQIARANASKLSIFVYSLLCQTIWRQFIYEEVYIVQFCNMAKQKTPKKTLREKRLKQATKQLSSQTRRQKKKIAYFVVLGLMSIWLFWGLPLPTKLSAANFPVSTKIFDRKGQLIYEIFTDKKSDPVALDDVPQHVIDATLAIEDKDFYDHYGVSFTGVTRAAFNTLFRSKLQGGSTLTQQLVKNALLSPERTIRRKARELLLTLLVESIYSKDKILELYLNQIPYGSTAYGIGAASNLYFGKSAKDLTLAEAALLAGLTQAPTKYSPFGVNPDAAVSRQHVVLSLMVDEGYITQEQEEEAKNQEVKFAQAQSLTAPHFALWIKEQLAEEYGDAVVEQGGLRVTTTLYLDLQKTAEEAVAEEVAKLADQNVGNGAAIVLKPDTGEILAMVGSKDYQAEDEDGKVNIIFANRQPGSSIKPLNYALALRDEKITLSTPIADIPTCFAVVGQQLYCPVNYDFTFHGATQVRFALGNSYNIPAVKVLALNGLENFVEFAKEMGLSTLGDPENYGLSLTLGGGEVRPIDMATAFGVFANQGIKVEPFGILKVEDYKGKVLAETNTAEIEGDRILDAEVTYLISHVLLDNNARSQSFGAGSFLNVRGHPEVSVKTGTTNDFKDNWTIGYTGQAVVTTWVGNNDNTPMRGAISGVSGASPIWNIIMGAVLDKAEDGFYDADAEGHAWPQEPEGIVGRVVCWQDGRVANQEGDPGCESRFEYFLTGSLPAVNTEHRDVFIDKTTGALAGPDIPPEQIEPQGHQILFDPLGEMFCLDCPNPVPAWSSTIRYPL